MIFHINSGGCHGNIHHCSNPLPLSALWRLVNYHKHTQIGGFGQVLVGHLLNHIWSLCTPYLNKAVNKHTMVCLYIYY